MDSDIIKLRSQITPALKRSKALVGTVLASIGMTTLLFGSLFLSVEKLSLWGLPIFVLGFGFISWGLVPYRKINKLEVHPHEIVIKDDKSIRIYLRGKGAFTLPINSIDKIGYKDSDINYGIGIWLRQPVPEKIIVHDRTFNMPQYQLDSKKKFGCDLFLPYFSKSSFEEMRIL